MVTLPCAPIVAPVDTMIANITRFEKPIPTKTSARLVRCLRVAAAADRSVMGSGVVATLRFIA